MRSQGYYDRVTALLVVLVMLSTYRLTRLVTADELSQPAREWLVSRHGPDSRLTYFIECPWCVSVWLAVPIAWLGLVHRAQTWAQVLGLALSASAVTGLISSVEP